MAVHPDHPSPRPTRSMPVIETHRGLLVHARHTLHDGPAHDGPAHDGPAAPTAHSPSLLWPAFTATAHLTSSCAQYYRHPPLLQPTCWPATAPCPPTCSPPAPTYACSALASCASASWRVRRNSVSSRATRSGALSPAKCSGTKPVLRRGAGKGSSTRWGGWERQ